MHIHGAYSAVNLEIEHIYADVDVKAGPHGYGVIVDVTGPACELLAISISRQKVDTVVIKGDLGVISGLNGMEVLKKDGTVKKRVGEGHKTKIIVEVPRDALVYLHKISGNMLVDRSITRVCHEID